MADITRTAGDVRPLPGAMIRRFDAGGTLYTGYSVYIAADGDVEASAAADSLTATSIGIFVADNTGSTIATDGDRVDVCVLGPVTGFSSMTPGALAFASSRAGGLVHAVPSAGSFPCVVGVAESATILFVNPTQAHAYVVKA